MNWVKMELQNRRAIEIAKSPKEFQNCKWKLLKFWAASKNYFKSYLLRP
jgi:hypothetical protein